MERFVHVEKGSFTPLVFSTSFGIGIEATKFVNRIAELISKKKNEEYADVINQPENKIKVYFSPEYSYSDTWCKRKEKENK